MTSRSRSRLPSLTRLLCAVLGITIAAGTACATGRPQRATVPYNLGPADWSFYIERRWDDGYSDGCLRSASGATYVRWFSQGPAGYRSLDDVISHWIWRHEEAYPGLPGRVVYGVARSDSSDVLVVNTRWMTFVSPVRSPEEIERVLGIARAREFGVACDGCAPMPIVPRYQSNPLGAGCSLPLNEPRAGASAAVIENVRASNWSSVFPPIDGQDRVYQVVRGMGLELVCDGGVLAGVEVAGILDRMASPLDHVHPTLDREGFESALRRIARVIDLGLPTPLRLEFGDLAGLKIGWPVHAQLGRAIVTASVSGDAGLSIWSFAVWFYRPVSGLVRSVRRPAGSDRRTAFEIDGKWYWTSEEIGATLQPGARVTDVLAAGPDDGALWRPPTCPGGLR